MHKRTRLHFGSSLNVTGGYLSLNVVRYWQNDKLQQTSEKTDVFHKTDLFHLTLRAKHGDLRLRNPMVTHCKSVYAGT